MRHQLQIPIYFAKLCAGPVADTAVTCLAVLCLLTSKHSWRGMAYKRPITDTASFANVALLLSTTTGSSGGFAASVAAALVLSICFAVGVSYGNIQACLYIVRAINIGFNLSLLTLPVATTSALIHILIAWRALGSGTKAHVIHLLYEIFHIRGFALVMLGRRRPFTVEDIRDLASEEELCRKCEAISNDRTKSPSLGSSEAYKPPVLWRVVQLCLDLMNYVTAEVSAAPATTSYISVAETISYLDITLLEYSIRSLTRFTRTVARLNSKLPRFRAYKAYVQELLDADSANYIERIPIAGDSAVELD
ncbi:hypothetical protein GGI17_006212 [Coemansia sp. S146]|nr:hypothetical protein GGI17_006212 [Coemansia sp. S146]